MKQAAAPTTHSPHGKNPSALGAIGMDLLDTAWRMALPVIALVVPALFVDRALGSAPWVTLGAALAGLILAGLLVRRQIAKLEEADRS